MTLLDSRGTPLAVGDKVIIPGTLTGVTDGTLFNCYVMADLPGTPGEKPSTLFSALNTRQITKVSSSVAPNAPNDGIIPLTPEQIVAAEALASKEGYMHRVIVGLDMFLNDIGGGHVDETISSRAARDAEYGNKVGIAISKFLDVIQHNHGAGAQAADIWRALEVQYLEQESPGMNG